MSKKKNVTLDGATATMFYTDETSFPVIESNSIDTVASEKIVESEDIVDSKPVKSCKILKKFNTGTAVIDFDGFGIIIDINDDTADEVEIEYTGKIGHPDFKYEVKIP